MFRVKPRPIQLHPTPLQAVADRRAQAFGRAVYSALLRVRASASLDVIESAVREGGPSAAVEVPDWSAYWQLAKAKGGDVEQQYIDLIVAGSHTETAFKGVFNLVNERAVAIAQRNAAELVVGLAADSRLAIQHVIGESLGGNLTVAQAARLIKDTVGLNPARAQAVANFRSALVNDTFNPGDWALADRRYGYSALSQEQVDLRVSRYAERQVASRAQTIARTETMRAAHQGQLETWRAAQERGLITQDAQRVWVTTEDDRTCEECADMDGQTISMSGSFSGSGGDTSEEPPIHPQCRCTSSLEDDLGD